MKIPEWVKPTLWGAAAGAVALAVVGFYALGWVTSGTAKHMADQQSQEAVLTALVPICLEQARNDPRQPRLLVELQEISGWKRGDKIAELGWATMPGAEEPIRGIARACANEITKSFDKS